MPHRVRDWATALAAATMVAALGAPASASAERPTGKPVYTTPPTIGGTAAERKSLKVESKGAWTGAAPITYSYAWSRCNAAGAECRAITGADTRGYHPVAADVGHRLVATVKGTNSEGSAEASSQPSQVVAAAGPRHKGTPAISGEAVDGRLLTVAEGTWKGTPPFSYSYQWLRCGHGGCHEIEGATSQSYRVRTEDIGSKLKAIVKATNAAGSGTVKSKASAKVVPGSPLNLSAPSITGTELPGQTLEAHEGTWVGTPPISYSYQWYSCPALGTCGEIGQATERTYQVGDGQIGDSFEVVVKAKNAEGEASATSPETGLTGSGEEAPENIVKPIVTGLTVTGQTVQADEGLWKGTTLSYSYQWELCEASGSGCTEIKGAESPSFLIPDGDAGDTLRVIVTATNGVGTVPATSEASTQILGVGPSNTEPPGVSGTPTAGQLLTASSGKWSGTEPITYEYEWLRCNASGEACTQAQAPSLLPTYVAQGADVNHTLRANVIATNIAGKGEAAVGGDRDDRGREALEPDRADRRRARDHGADAERDGRNVDGHRTDHVRLPVAVVLEVGDGMRERERRRIVLVQDPGRRRGSHAARRGDRQKRGRLRRKGIGRDHRSARCRSVEHGTAGGERHADRGAAVDGLVR